MPIPHLVRRAWSAPLWAHALALAVLLLALMPVIGTSWQWSADEGAVLAQAQHLADGDGWRFHPPFPEADPRGEWFPIHLSEQAADGRWVPYAKLPLYPVLLSFALSLGGLWAVVSLSILGTAVAAWSAGRLAGELRGSAGRPALWAVGALSPLLFYSYSVIAHSLGAAFAGLAAVGVMTWWRGRTWGLLLVVFGCVGCVALRNEATLLVGAAVLVLLIAALHGRSTRLGVAAGVVAVTGLAAFSVNRIWYRTILDGGSGIGPPALGDDAPFFAARWSGFVQTMVQSEPKDLLTVAAVFFVLGAVLLRLRKSSRLIVTTCFWLGAACCLLAAVAQPTAIIPGLLVVSPLFVVGWLTLKRVDLDGPALALLVISALFALGVFATQYAVGGSGEWGGRYYAIAWPLAAVPAVLALERLWRERDPSWRVQVIAPVVIASLVLSMSSLWSLREVHDRTARVIGGVVAAAAMVDAGDGGRPVVIATIGIIGRLAWQQLDDGRWLLVEKEDDLDAAFRQIGSAGVTQVAFVLQPDESPPPVPGWQVVSTTELDRGYAVATYRRA